MKNVTIHTLLLSLTLSGCATMNDSLTLGAGIGTVTGGAATAAGYAAGGKSPSFSNIAVGAGIGMALGLVTSYFTHKSVEETRNQSDKDAFDVQFGDLPPSPFLVPKTPLKKGAR